MTASDPITTISDNALLMGCFCARRLIAPPTQTAAKTKKRTRCNMIFIHPAETARPVQPSESRLLQCHHQGSNHNVRDGERQKKFPAEGHELVIAETRQRAADPDVDENESKYPHGEPENRQQRLHDR